MEKMEIDYKKLFWTIFGATLSAYVAGVVLGVLLVVAFG